MARTDGWAASWVREHIVSHDKVINVDVCADHLIAVEVQGLSAPVMVATVSVDPQSREDCIEICQDDEIEFLLNIKKDALIHGSAIEFGEFKCIGIGGLGDFYTAANEMNFSGYPTKRSAFHY